MPDVPDKPAPMLSTKQLMAAILALSLNGAVPLLTQHGPSDSTEKAIERIGDELANIRASLVTTQIDMTKALATAMQELTDHSRRLEMLEDRRKR